jgi:uncharacterized protein YndB with AHSA1/START domain
MIIQDRIEREITIKASKERIFAAIVDPKQIVRWFPDSIEGQLNDGETAVFGFGERSRYSVQTVSVQPYDYLSYRWVPTDDPKGFVGDVTSRPSTLVEFRLREDATGTVVTVTESGFSSLPPQVMQKSFPEHVEGWAVIVTRLLAFLDNP